MRKITIKNLDGTLEEVDLIKAFGIADINKNFVILSKNETSADGLSKVYVSEVVKSAPGVYDLIGISDDALWDKVKQAMKDIIQG